MSDTAAVPGTANGPTPRKQHRNTPVNFPVQFHIALTFPMKASLERLSRRLLLKEGVIGRIALMQYLAANDPQYREPQ
jgi:hypothetical protein